MQGLDEETLHLLWQVAKRVEYPPNTTLCHRVKWSTFYVVKGNVAIVRVLTAAKSAS
ncbi:MAG: hypothetical protein R3D55_21705 [Chloroflexota bacterium]